MQIIVTLIALGAVVCGVTSGVYWLRSAFEEPARHLDLFFVEFVSDRKHMSPREKGQTTWIDVP